eukprot:176539-Pyramimonas_sp.AAC.1
MNRRGDVYSLGPQLMPSPLSLLPAFVLASLCTRPPPAAGQFALSVAQSASARVRTALCRAAA